MLPHRRPLIGLPHILCALLVLGSGSIALDAQTPPEPRSGPELYRAACAACHGPDGTGMPAVQVGVDMPPASFADCTFATREPDGDWMAVAHDGGPARSFSRRMPAFGAALTREELQRIIDHMRTMCVDPAWPRGELNLPRALVTEKAFPEDEAVLTTVVQTGGNGGITNELLYERRIGARNQVELVVPIAARESAAGVWSQGLGDAAIAWKRVMHHDLAAGRIASLTGEVVFPTGKETQGLGKGVTIFEPFATYGQVLPSNGFFHAQAGAELSTDRSKSQHEAFWRFAVGRTFEQSGFGRAWSPMVEVLAARELSSGERVVWDLLPQMQVTLNKRQHIMLSGGVRLPVNEREGRKPQVLAYLLWDWFDGGFLDGW